MANFLKNLDSFSECLYLLPMIRTIIITIALICTGVLFSQEIVDPTKVWSNMEEHCQPWGSTFSTDFIRFDIDTIIDDQVYKKVWISEDEEQQEWNFYGAFIREEDGRIYYRQMFGEEGLIYDFNLEVGDSVLIDNPRSAGALTLFFTEIDSVEITNGYRERWKLVSNTYENPEYWIRGIGSQTGVINSSTGVYGGLCGLYTLLCQKVDNELVYQNSDIGSCFMITTAINDNYENQPQFSLSYDRNNKIVKLQMENEQFRTITLSNITGNIIESKQTNGTLMSFNLSQHAIGLYVVTVVQSGSVYSQKFIVY